jgi:hypothetical protein
VRVSHCVEEYERDIVIRLTGKAKKRRKRLSRKEGGNSHTVSLAVAKYIFDKRAQRLIIGTGQEGHVQLSEEAQEYFQKSARIDPISVPPDRALGQGTLDR